MAQVCPVCERTNIDETSQVCPQCDADLEGYALLNQVRQTVSANYQQLSQNQIVQQELEGEKKRLENEVVTKTLLTGRYRRILVGTAVVVLMVSVFSIYIILSRRHLQTAMAGKIEDYRARIASLEKANDQQVKALEAKVEALQLEQSDLEKALEQRGQDLIYTHPVSRGDSLSSISKFLFGTELRFDEIRRLNRIVDADTILIGQRLKIPLDNQ